MLATTLQFNYEVRSAREAFDDIPQAKVDAEMLDLAKHIIKTKSGKFDPASFDDRYEEALAEVVRAKLEGRKLKPRAAPVATKVVDLMEALRESAKAPRSRVKAAGKPKARAAGKKGTRARRKKAA